MAATAVLLLILSGGCGDSRQSSRSAGASNANKEHTPAVPNIKELMATAEKHGSDNGGLDAIVALGRASKESSEVREWLLNLAELHSTEPTASPVFEAILSGLPSSDARNAAERWVREKPASAISSQGARYLLQVYSDELAGEQAEFLMSVVFTKYPLSKIREFGMGPRLLAALDSVGLPYEAVRLEEALNEAAEGGESIFWCKSLSSTNSGSAEAGASAGVISAAMARLKSLFLLDAAGDAQLTIAEAEAFSQTLMAIATTDVWREQHQDLEFLVEDVFLGIARRSQRPQSAFSVQGDRQIAESLAQQLVQPSLAILATGIASDTNSREHLSEAAILYGEKLREAKLWLAAEQAFRFGLDNTQSRETCTQTARRLAEIYIHELSAPSRAVDVLREATSRDSTPHAHLYLARVLSDLGQDDAALSELSDFLAQTDDTKQQENVLYLQAYLLSRLERKDEARALAVYLRESGKEPRIAEAAGVLLNSIPPSPQ